MLSDDEGDGHVNYQHKRGEARHQSKDQQQRRKKFREHGQGQAGRDAEAERIHEVRLILAEVHELVQAVQEEHLQSDPDPQNEQREIGGGGIIGGRKDFFDHGSFEFGWIVRELDLIQIKKQNLRGRFCGQRNLFFVAQRGGIAGFQRETSKINFAFGNVQPAMAVWLEGMIDFIAAL